MGTNTKSSFAAGILVATFISGAVYFLEPSKAATLPTLEEPSVVEMKETLASEGYVIYSQEEWKEQLVAMEEAAIEKVSLQSESTNESTESEEAVVYKTVINIASGMTSIDVGRVLVQAEISDSAMSFVHEVEKRGLSNNLRPGTYEINSNMTVDDVIALVFK
ncbi:endolytic transglycosylase MltG [Bacillus pinisoli]|uniref:endolytic transglycosylase MltG n=1 Tax=Bacillus pinisoli TaxID=2901866 RepID=UPI001FF18FBA|nr:endolytic transglycosylase MltG [Bacillus pinisoli]